MTKEDTRDAMVIIVKALSLAYYLSGEKDKDVVAELVKVDIADQGESPLIYFARLYRRSAEIVAVGPARQL